VKQVLKFEVVGRKVNVDMRQQAIKAPLLILWLSHQKDPGT